jgi:hypothetical protein
MFENGVGKNITPDLILLSIQIFEFFLLLCPFQHVQSLFQNKIGNFLININWTKMHRCRVSCTSTEVPPNCRLGAVSHPSKGMGYFHY